MTRDLLKIKAPDASVLDRLSVNYWRQHQIQVAYVEFEALGQALCWPSFEPLERPEKTKR